MADSCPDCYGSGFTAETLLCGCQIGRSMDAALAPWRTEVERLRRGLLMIADRKYCDYEGNPARWATSIAYLALGGRHKNGQRLDDTEALAGSVKEAPSDD